MAKPGIPARRRQRGLFSYSISDVILFALKEAEVTQILLRKACPMGFDKCCSICQQDSQTDPY